MVDHTLGTSKGSYIYVDVRDKGNDKRFRIQTRPLEANKERCLEFYYHAYGEDVNALNVYLKQNNILGSPVWSKVKNQGNEWLRGEVRIHNIKNPYQIVLEGVSGNTYQGVCFTSFFLTLDLI